MRNPFKVAIFFVRFKSTFYLDSVISQHVFPKEESPANSTPEILILRLMEDISLHGISQEEKNSY